MKDRVNDHSKYQLWIDPNKVIPYSRNVKIHTDKQIETAFCHCEKNVKGFREMKAREMVRAVRTRLEERARRKAKGKGAPAPAKAAPQDHGLLLEGLRGCMDDPDVQTTAP